MTERLIVFRNSRNLGDRVFNGWLAHFARVHDWKRRLFLEGFHTPVPELCIVVKRVENGRSVALAGSAFDTDRNWSAVSESERRIVACAARHGSVDRQASIKEQLLAEGNCFWRLRVVRGYGCTCGVDRHSNLF